ncbi:MAG: ABC transporter permease subunit [Alphaproteobacteria bacterium]|nr:ABC transporter permease subunit [Alphaproteobacteria bacterium]
MIYKKNYLRINFFLLLGLTLLMYLYGKEWCSNLGIEWAIKYPKHLIFPLKIYISNFVKWLMNDAHFIIFSFKDLTRSISWIIEQPYQFILSLFAMGFYRGQGQEALLILPALSWTAVITIITSLAIYTKDKALVVLVALSFFYLAVFGQWNSAMITLSSIIIAVPIGVLLGLSLGIASYKSQKTEQFIKPILSLMQTIPVFAYLVPILVMFGFGPVSALIATIIYAMPPMVHTTILALKSVDPQIKDFGLISGCTNRQLMWRVLIPSAKSTIMVGVNQVIMLSFNMVIIASMIGAGGLGYDVLTSLRKLDIGGGFESGLAIVILAVALDRLSQAYVKLRPDSKSKNQNLFKSYKLFFICFGVMIISYLVGFFSELIRNYPDALTVSTSSFWEDSMRHININYYDLLESIKVFLLIFFLMPIKKFFLAIPWPWTVTIITIIAWHYGKFKLSILTFLLLMFIVISGLWTKAMITIYLCGSSVVIACIIGIPLGIFAGLNKKADRVLTAFIDTLQTLPSFVYLIPVVMLFRVGDFTAMIAVVLYALAPAIRYTALGIKNINSELIEASLISGCTDRQLLFKVRLPLALPQILLGINQTIMLALSMLVITALVGTRDLGQEVYIALTKADIGRGLVAGLCVAFIAIIADKIIVASSNRLKIKYGL